MQDYALDIALYILTLANRNDPICVVLPKVVKASTGASLFPTVLLTNVTNVNDPFQGVLMKGKAQCT